MGSWVKKIAKIYKTMSLLEKKKSTDPCLSNAMGGLAQCLRTGVYGPLMKLPLSLATVLEYSQTLPAQPDNLKGNSYGLGGEGGSPQDAHSITVGSNHLQDPIDLPIVIHQKSSEPRAQEATREDSVDSQLLEREATDLFEGEAQDPMQHRYPHSNNESAGAASQRSGLSKQEQLRSGSISPRQLNQDLRSVTPATDAANTESWQPGTLVTMTASVLQKARGHRLIVSSKGPELRDNLSRSRRQTHRQEALQVMHQNLHNSGEVRSTRR